MSHPAEPSHQPPANPPDQKGVAEDSDDRLVKPLRVSKKMRPFGRRMRMGVDDLDLGDPAKSSQFERSREEMSSILAKKKVAAVKAKRAIAETLETWPPIINWRACAKWTASGIACVLLATLAN